MNLHKCGVHLVFRVPDCWLFAGTRNEDQQQPLLYPPLFRSFLFCSLSLPLSVPRYHLSLFSLSLSLFPISSSPPIFPLFITELHPNCIRFPLLYRMFLQFDLFHQCDTPTSTFSHTCCLTAYTNIFAYCHSLN